MPFPSRLALLPPHDPTDPRERLTIRNRPVLVPRAWRRCASGVTFDPPPTLREAAPTAPRLTAFDREVLQAIRTLAGRTGRPDGGVGRKSLQTSLFNHPTISAERAAALDEAVTRLRARGLVAVEELPTGATLYRPMTEAA